MKAKYIILAAAALAALSCNKFEKLSKNPYAMESNQGKSESFVQPMLYKTGYNLASVFRSTTSQLMQYAITTTSDVTSRIVANYNIPEGTSDDVWSGLYIQFGNARKMYETAVREDNKSMQAVALVMQSMLISLITDTYGDVPFEDAGRIILVGAESDKYTTGYDSQKDIYRGGVVMLEEANALFAESEDVQFSPICDRTYAGDLDKWRRFGNALYAKVLNRIAMKVIEEDEGILELDDKWGAISVTAKLSELYGCFVSGAGTYPTMRDRGDGALAFFDYDDEYAHTPFYSITSGIWNSVAACDVLMRRMLDTTEKIDSDGITYYSYLSPEKGGHPVDPRWDCYYRKAGAAPTQMLSEAQKRFFDSDEHKSSAGNSLVGRMTNGEVSSGITGKVFDVKNPSHYALMNFSELCFIFAEAGARGYIADASSYGAYQGLLKRGVTENILEWRSDLDDETPEVVVERPSLTGFRMDMTVDVSKGTHVKAYLNSDHSNYIDLMGGGTLRMVYSPADNLQLTGRYTLSNGEMKYQLPVIPLKTFTIQDGSYVEFTGEMMNPTLNITATEQTKASVSTSGEVGRSVDFVCGVIITKTLNDMGLQFIIDAPEDMQLHSELQAMSKEEQSKLAVTMLTTGMYLNSASTGSFSMNSALSSFLNSQISSISGNALRTLDLSFGMDNTTDASGQQHTDYSFKFAKRFLNNRLKVAVGGKVTTGEEMPGGRNNSFFDNVSMEYRLDQSATKYLNFYFENNSYDWLDGYSQKYGGGFIWRRSLQKFTDIFRLKEPLRTVPAVRRDTLKTTPAHETK